MQKKLRAIKLFTQVVVLFSILATFNLLVAHLSRNTVPRQILLNAKSSENATDLFVGNSLIQSGFDKSVFEANLSNRKAINLGLGSSSPVEHYLFLKSSTNHYKANIWYGFFDTQLTDAIKSDYESLFGNRAASYYIEPETAISLYASNDFIRAWQIRLTSKIPMLVERGSIWATVERMRRTLGETGMPHAVVNHFGRNEDFKMLEASDEKSFVQICQTVIKNKTKFNSGTSYILQLAKQRHTKITFILMPMTQKHRKKFYGTSSWRTYKTYVSDLIQINGGTLIDASDWITDDGFSDGLHLNKLGANLFSQKIAILNKS